MSCFYCGGPSYTERVCPGCAGPRRALHRPKQQFMVITAQGSATIGSVCVGGGGGGGKHFASQGGSGGKGTCVYTY